MHTEQCGLERRKHSCREHGQQLQGVSVYRAVALCAHHGSDAAGPDIYYEKRQLYLHAADNAS